MVAEFQRQVLGIRAYRAGSPGELAIFLSDIEYAYNSILLFYQGDFEDLYYFPYWRAARRTLRTPPRNPRPEPEAVFIRSEQILPRLRIELQRVVIRSPGFWEFAGALNPLQQIREYLKDRHERVRDIEFRDDAQRRKLDLENDLLERQIYEKENSILRQRIDMMRDIGFSNEQIQQRMWSNIGEPLSKLGKHQDHGLIGAPISTDRIDPSDPT